MSVAIKLSDIRDILARYRPVTGETEADIRASVAVVLREARGGVELLLIRRAEREGDPWSGHIAFPGGRVDPGDRGPRHTAERETFEEVGVALEPHECFGRLDDLTGHAASVRVSAFLYAIDREVSLRPAAGEVEHVFWMPVAELVNTKRHVTYVVRWDENEAATPAIRVLEEDAPVLWGLTYRFLERLFALLGHYIPPMRWHDDEPR